MAYTTINELMTAIANAIRSKKGTTAKISSQDMPTEIESITTGGNYQSKTITQNGTYLPDEGYDAFSDVTVNCEGSEDWEIKNCEFMFNFGYRLYKDRCETIINHIKKPNSCGYMFQNCSSYDINDYFDISNLDTSEVDKMWYMFNNCEKTISLDLSKWNTSNVTDMKYMFYNCSLLTSLDISSFNTSNVTDMFNMFGSCAKLTSLDLSNFDTSKVTNMSNMFNSCAKLTSLDLSNFDTSNVTNMYNMLSLKGRFSDEISKCTSIKGFSATGIKSGTLSLFGSNPMPNLKHFTFKDAFYSTACTDAVTINMARLKGLEEGDETTGVIEMFNSLPENTTSYTHVIKLHTNVYNLLSDATKSIATDKGYSITYGTS